MLRHQAATAALGLLGVLVFPAVTAAEQVTLTPAIQGWASDRFAAEFPLASIPADAPITSATLSLTVRYMGHRRIQVHGYQATGTLPPEAFTLDGFVVELLLYYPRCFPPSIPCYPVTVTYDVNATSRMQTLVHGPNRFAGFSLRGASGVEVLAITLSVGYTPPVPVTMYAVTADHRLLTFNSTAPTVILREVPLSGLPAGEVLADLDVRPLTGALYALGRHGRLYTIDRHTGLVSAATAASPLAGAGALLAIDFVPTDDLLRVVSDAGLNLRIHPDSGEILIDTPFDGEWRTGSVAYVNNVSGAPDTTLYGIAAASDRLIRLGGVGGSPSPNEGVASAVGAFGVDATEVGGLDVAALTGHAFAALTVNGMAGLYVVNLDTGGAGLVGPIGDGTPRLRGLAAAPVLRYALTEGATGAFFDTDLLLANPNPEPVTLAIDYLRDYAAPTGASVTVAANSRQTLHLDEVAGLDERTLGIHLMSSQGLPVLVERTMRWDQTGYGAHTERAAHGPARHWYFAEGAQGFFDTYLLLANPSPGHSQATLTFLMDAGPPVVRVYPLSPMARVTVWAGAIPELVHRAFGVHVEFGAPGTAERAMYFGWPLFDGGHASAGAVAPAATWFFAEGATGPFFTTFVLLANPLAVPSSVTLMYLSDAGPPVIRTHTVAPRQRLSINVANEDPALRNAAVAIAVQASSPIVAERSQYWPGAPGEWQGAHNSGGATRPATKWGLAEGRVGGAAAYQTYVLLGNPGAAAARVSLDFLRTTGAVVTKGVVVPPRSRVTVSVGPGTLVPELNDEEFGTVVRSDEPIVVERAMYSDAAGVVWASGTAAAAMRLP